MAFIIPDGLKLVIFDLDDTLHKYLHGTNKTVRNIVNFFQLNGIDMAVASLNTLAHFFLFDYGIIEKFKCIEARKFSDECCSNQEAKVHRSNFKTHMFLSIIKKVGTNRKNVLIFDDNIVHILEAQKLGIPAVHVNADKLITWNNVADGLRYFKPGGGKRISCHF